MFRTEGPAKFRDHETTSHSYGPEQKLRSASELLAFCTGGQDAVEDLWSQLWVQGIADLQLRVCGAFRSCLPARNGPRPHRQTSRARLRTAPNNSRIKSSPAAMESKWSLRAARALEELKGTGLVFRLGLSANPKPKLQINPQPPSPKPEHHL